MELPAARGPVSAAVLAALAGDGPVDEDRLVAAEGHLPDEGLTTDDDVNLALHVLYELHYRGFEGVPAEREWDPALIRFRTSLEDRLLSEVRVAAAEHVQEALGASGDLPSRLFALTESVPGPSLASYLQRQATREQFVEYLQHKSIYHLKESDPQSFVLPRLTGRAKVALAELQYDEYGGGRPERLHQQLFARGMEAAGLSSEDGTYLEQVPGVTLAVTNLMSLFALRRSLAPAAMGHLGAFEATSSEPCRKVAGGSRRLGLPDAVATYFDEHVEADAVHEQLAFRDICAVLVADDPGVEADVLMGATAYLQSEARAGQAMLDAWAEGRSSLRAVAGTPRDGETDAGDDLAGAVAS
jgi:hypothetical protein